MNSTFIATPYKGFHGRAEYDSEDECFSGELIGIRDVITFVGDTPKALQKAFEGSVDDYLAWCKKRGKKPNKPFSGKFMIRLNPDLHRTLSNLAEAKGMSLNALVANHLQRVIATDANDKPAISRAALPTTGGRRIRQRSL